MSFREKSAWITLLTVLVCFGSYYAGLATGLIDPLGFQSFHLGLIAIIGVVVLQVGLRLVAMLQNPAEARTPRDERERMIEAKSHTVGYYLMMIGMIAVVITTHLPLHPRFMVTVYFGMGVVIVSTMAVAIAQIVMFRRGA